MEVRLESEQAATSQKKQLLDHTQVVPQGIKMDELGQIAKSGSRGFEKKSNTGTKIFIIAAIVTPTTDILNMCIFAAPMVALYIVSIGIAWLVHPKQRKARQARKDR